MVEGFPIPTGKYASDENTEETVFLSHLHAHLMNSGYRGKFGRDDQLFS